MKGRKPTPTKVLESRGSWRAKLREGEPEPEQVDSAISAPDDLPDDGKVLWEKLFPQLTAMKVLSDSDLTALADLCRAHAEFHAITRQLEVDGMTVETEQGMKAHPLLPERHRAWQRFAAGIMRFGLSPVDRTRVRVVDAKPKSDPRLKLFKPKGRTG